MTFQVRRVVTGHDASGKAIVMIDETSPVASMRPGVSATVAWTSEGFPVNNNGEADEGTRKTGTTHTNGTVFRIIEFAPGNVIVQRGTIHNWINRGSEPCVIAFVLIAALPAIAGGKMLPAVG